MKRTWLFGPGPMLTMALSLPMACSADRGSATAADEPAGDSAAPVTSEPQTAADSFTGDIVETMDAGTYTYVLLDGDGEQVWAAGPKTAVTIGDEVTIPLHMKMENFESETLGRKFETIYFVTSLGPGSVLMGHGKPADPDAGLSEPMTSDPHAGLSEPMMSDPHAGLSEPMMSDPHAGLAQKTETEIDPESIEKPEGGYRVAELWDRREELVGQEVAIRGRVVKYNGGILGRNWLHVQDGTGDPEKKTHDLTVTAEGASTVGDLVLVRGVVAIDKDFGAGYRYGLIVENATVEVD